MFGREGCSRHHRKGRLARLRFHVAEALLQQDFLRLDRFQELSELPRCDSELAAVAD